MVEWIREGSLAWVIVNSGHFHFPRKSAWRIASTIGWDASIGTPELKFALDRARIQIPLLRQENNTVVETQVLQGYGVGVSAGINVQIPVINLDRSTSSDPGSGTPIYESPFCPEPLQANNLEGICLALSGNATKPGEGIGGRQGAITTLIFGDKLGFGSILPTAINAVAFVDGMSTNWGDFAGAGVEIVYYNLVCKSVPTSLGK